MVDDGTMSRKVEREGDYAEVSAMVSAKSKAQRRANRPRRAGLRGLSGKLHRHWRRGTLWDALLARFGGTPLSVRVKYHGAKNVREGAKALAKQARRLTDGGANGAWVLTLGDENRFHRELKKQLRERKVPFESVDLDNTAAWELMRSVEPTMVLCGFPDFKHIKRAAGAMGENNRLAQTPFEYAPGLDKEIGIFRNLDEYANTTFVSPVLLDEPSPYEIYQESLKYFEQKCGLRDFLDLYQLLKTVVENDVSGDIAEFGSYKGHSGWLIARSLQAFGSKKRLFMFDAFESFPNETLGVDAFWSSTHKVDFEQVKSKLCHFDNVFLVKGDFTETLENSELNQVALAYIDCDSYRATKFLFNRLISKCVPYGGIVICEDYGHPALLGSRLAVHESCGKEHGLIEFFSHYSGLYIVIRN